MFEALPELPADPILGLSAAFKAESNPNKIDLGVGVYKDETGQTPILGAVQKAQEILLAKENSKVYIAPAGVEGFISGMLDLILGTKSQPLEDGRIAAVQAPGGCGALRILAELINKTSNNTTVWVSDPTWANHTPLLGNAGLKLATYPYFDKQTGGVKFDEMLASLQNVNAGDIVLLHGCCHNPTGADLSPEQWDQILEVAQKTGFIPFVDIAYQGFGDNLEQDVYGVRLLTENLPEVLIAASCSKNFGLYRERVGLAAIVTANTQVKKITQSQIQSIARGIYSMPPSYGGALVDIVLNTPDLKQIWQQEVTDMRVRMQSLRQLLVDELAAQEVRQDFAFITRQKGMFSYLCISPEQVRKVRQDFGVYFVDSSRINVAGISQGNVKYLAQSLAKVL